MPINTPTAPAQKIDQKEAQKIAESLLAPKREVAKNVAEFRKGVQDVLTQVKGMQGVEEEVQKVADNMDEQKMGTEFGNVKIDDLGDGVKGVNKGLSKDTAIHKNELTVKKLAEQPKDVGETLNHEDSEEDGHAGQTSKLRTVIDAQGKVKTKKVQLEGEVETNMGKLFRGDASAKRSDQPEETYGEGQDFISQHHEAARAYIRKDGEYAGDAGKFQAEVLKKSSLSPEEIEQKLQEQTDFNRAEILDIIVASAKKPGEKAKTPDHAMAA